MKYNISTGKSYSLQKKKKMELKKEVILCVTE
ncbi:MAG: hypothetical protein XE08_0211 [Parcubacteria bacterium 32_520]|nr:MAG: hypothetical protein XE08_0211 [Parcubacteria bacterium 32_520]